MPVITRRKKRPGTKKEAFPQKGQAADLCGWGAKDDIGRAAGSQPTPNLPLSVIEPLNGHMGRLLKFPLSTPGE